MLVKKLTKYKHPHRMCSKVTSFTQLLKETHNTFFLLLSQCRTRLRIHKAAGWRPPNSAVADDSEPHTSELAGVRQESKGVSVSASLPGIQFHAANPPPPHMT